MEAWVYAIEYNPETNSLSYAGPELREIPESMAAKFKWDKLIRVDLLWLNKSIFMHLNEDIVTAFANGVSAQYDLAKNAKELFSKEFKEDFDRTINTASECEGQHESL